MFYPMVVKVAEKTVTKELVNKTFAIKVALTAVFFMFFYMIGLMAWTWLANLIGFTWLANNMVLFHTASVGFNLYKMYTVRVKDLGLSREVALKSMSPFFAGEVREEVQKAAFWA